MIFRKAILIIHGFAGGTYDQEKLANYLELNRDFDVYQYTLPGHKRNLSKVKSDEWIKSSENMIEWLINNRYHKIYLIGHSMGGVIATYLASKYKEVKKLVLAAPAFHYLDVKDKNLNVSESLKMIPNVIKTYGGDEIVSRMLKLNINAIGQFMTLIRDYYDFPKDVKCPTLIIQGNNDNLVPITSSKYVYDNIQSKEKEIIYIDDLTHDVFEGNKKEEVFKIVEEFLKEGGISFYDRRGSKKGAL